MAKESAEIHIAGIQLLRGSATPLYSQLYDQLRAMIVSGRLRAGERLPAGRNLAKELGVARVIVSQAYEQLVMEGYVCGKTGAGTFVADPVPDHLLHAKKIRRDAVVAKVADADASEVVADTGGEAYAGDATGVAAVKDAGGTDAFDTAGAAAAGGVSVTANADSATGEAGENHGAGAADSVDAIGETEGGNTSGVANAVGCTDLANVINTPRLADAPGAAAGEAGVIDGSGKKGVKTAGAKRTAGGVSDDRKLAKGSVAKGGTSKIKKIYGQDPIDRRAGGRITAVPFQIGMPALDQFPYKAWQQVGNQVLKDLKMAHLGYEDTLGYWNLRKAIAAYLRIARAVTCEAEQVIVVTGSQQGLNLIVAALLEKGDQVWLEDPGYHGARAAFQQAGANICAVPVTSEGIDVDYGMQHFPNAKMAYVTPSHQFPMGYTMSAARRAQLLAWAAEHKSWILEDDYDSEFRYEGRPLPSLQGMDQHGRVIYSGTFSKVMFPGMRLAYIVLPSVEMVDRFRKLKDNQDRQSPMMEQLMLCAFMDGGYFLRHIRKMRLLYAERQQQLLALLKKYLSGVLTVHFTPSGMHLLCWLPERIDLMRLKAALKREQVAVTFVSAFTLQHKVPPAIMLGFTAYTEYQMKQAMERLVVCLEEGMSGGSDNE